MNPEVQTASNELHCEYCKGSFPQGEQECPRCGAPIHGNLVDPALLELSLDEFILALHQKLLEAGTSAAELAFGVGCTLGVLVGGVLMVLIFLIFTKTWTVLAVILLILTLFSFLVSTILATRAREATTRATYQREIIPQIDFYLSRYAISQEAFDNQVAEILPAKSPLRVYSAAKHDPN